MSQSSHSRNVVIACWIVLLLMLAGLAAWILRPIWAKPKISLNLERRGQDVVFKMETKNILGLGEFIVIDNDAKQLLWYVNLNYFPGPELVYGKTPPDFGTLNGNINSARQEFPKNGQAPAPLPAG